MARALLKICGPSFVGDLSELYTGELTWCIRHRFGIRDTFLSQRDQSATSIDALINFWGRTRLRS